MQQFCGTCKTITTHVIYPDNSVECIGCGTKTGETRQQSLTLTEDELGTIEKWGRNWANSRFWNQDNDDEPLYNKICNILGIEGIQSE